MKITCWRCGGSGEGSVKIIAAKEIKPKGTERELKTSRDESTLNTVP